MDILQKGLHINALELLMIIVACKIWGHQWAGKRLLVKCDNETSINVTNSGKFKDYFMHACLRELAFVCATHKVEIKGVYIHGVSNRVTDILSRWDLDLRYQNEFNQLVGSEPTFDTFVFEGLFNLLMTGKLFLFQVDKLVYVSLRNSYTPPRRQPLPKAPIKI